LKSGQCLRNLCLGQNTPASADRGKIWEGVRQVLRIVNCPTDMELSSAKGRRIWHSNARVWDDKVNRGKRKVR
jgi:hypothetical protein